VQANNNNGQVRVEPRLPGNRERCRVCVEPHDTHRTSHVSGQLRIYRIQDLVILDEKLKQKEKRKRKEPCRPARTIVLGLCVQRTCMPTYNRRRPKPKASCLHDQPRKEKYCRSGRKSFHRECMEHRSFDRLLQSAGTCVTVLMHVLWLCC
jgi:hypothetical protein